MSDTPTPRSLQQIQGDMEDTLLAKLGIQNLRVGAPLLSILETAASSDFRSSQDIFQILNSISLDTATGLALERKGLSENVPKIKQSASIDVVTVSDSSFTKIQSKLFQGLPAPIVGSVTLNVSDASLFPTSGAVYVGRGTPNYEGPIDYSSKADAGTHWVLTLSASTVKFHNNTESVIVAQGGNRTIGPQTVVQTPQANLSSAITFKTVYSSTIPDGETSITGVLVQATTPGTSGNVPAHAINQFPTPPFTGAVVDNPKPFSNGQDTEDDDTYRERIKNVIKSRSKGTKLAITSAITGVTAPDENRRITSTSFVSKTGKPSTVYIDDGSGYEERVTGVAIESLIDSATGGEEYFQVANRPIAKAFAVTKNTAPFILSEGALLTVKVGGVTYIHNFKASQFNAISSASAYEVTASINSNPDLAFLARTSESGARVVLFAKEEHNDDIEVTPSTGNDSNASLGFPLGDNFTLQLYKNDRLLIKDGVFATVESETFSSWNAIVGSHTLIVATDGTPAITYTFVDQDFIDADTGFIAVGKNSLEAWTSVINAKIPGITAQVVGTKVFLTSNADTSSRASVSIEGGTLVAAHFFGLVSAVGANKDYTVDRSTGQIHLESVLEEFDRLSVGSTSTRAFLQSDEEINNVTLVDTNLWFVVDGDAEIITHGITKSSSVSIEVFELHDWGHTLKITALAGTPFSNVLKGDYIVLWDTALDASLQGSFRVSVATSTYVLVERRLALTLRSGHRSVALDPVGADISKVLTTGGSTYPNPIPQFNVKGPTAACEIYDPNTKTTIAAASMETPRVHHTATLVASGDVIVVGGANPDFTPINTIEIYDPTLDTWTTSAVTLTTGAYYHTATVMADGKILIAGGFDGVDALKKTYIYDPIGDSISVVGDLIAARYGHRAVLLSTNNILAAGGFTTGSVPTATCELFVPGGGAWAATGSMGSTRTTFCLQPIGPGVATDILAAGDSFGGANVATYEIYNIAGGTWGGGGTLPSSQLFEEHDGITLQNGTIALLNTYAAPASPAALTYTGVFALKIADPKYTESAVRYDAQYVLLSNNAASYLNHVVVVGGAENLTSSIQPTASYEEWDGNTFTWNVPDPAVTPSVTLADAGVSFVRTEGTIQDITVPAGTNYTASSLVAAFNSLLRGARATTYRTNNLRINTNTFAKSGDIALVSEDDNAAGIQLSVTSAIDNLTGHIGSVESGNSQIGTPSFEDLRILGYGKVAPIVADQALLVPGVNVDSSYTLVGLRNWTGGADGGSVHSPEFNYDRWANNAGAFSTLATLLSFVDTTQIYVRDEAVEPWTARDRVFLAAPFSIGPLDDLTVLVDNDIDRRFNINMYRKLSAVGNTYSDTNDFKDADAGDVSLATTFGLSYDFNDFAVYMKSRAVAFTGDASRKVLFRYFQYGPEGDGTRVRFSNPDAPNSSVLVEVDTDLQPTTDVRVKLAGGALRTPVVRIKTKLGATATAESPGGIASLIFVLNLPISTATRTANVTTATLTLPAGVTDHGLIVGDNVFVKSTDVNFSSGLKNITVRTATTISYSETAADFGPTANIGTVSYDTQGEATTAGSGILIGDFIRVDSPDFSFLGGFDNTTFYVTGFADGYITATSAELTGYVPSGTLIWTPIGQAQNLKIFANPSGTVASITTSVNALTTGEDFKNPISMTLLGAGAGTVVKSTPEQLDDTNGWYTLNDGINYVQTTDAPLTIAGDYSLQFKNAVNGDLATLADWENEAIYICPITVSNVVEWLNTPTVTGLWSLCSVEASSDGTKVQIASKTAGSKGGVQVQGGLSNSVTAAVVGGIRTHFDFPTWSLSTINRPDANGLHAGFWCKIENSISVPRSNIVTTLTELVSWNVDGTITLNVPVYTERMAKADDKVKFEKQGRYIAISDMGISPGVAPGDFFTVEPGDYIRITPRAVSSSFNPVSDANQGIFRVLRISNTNGYSAGTIWIENSIAVEEDSECNIAIYASDSVMPGDTLIVNTPLFGTLNQGLWTVDTVGTTTLTSNDLFTVNTKFKVSTETRSPVSHGASAALGVDSRLVQIIENSPAKFIRKIDTLVPNQVDGAFMDIRWDRLINSSTISASSGSIITTLDKLDFSIDFASGIDAYSYDNGLIGEANRIIQGDPADVSSYPGVAAAGAQINVSGPIIKRINIALSLRVKSGVSNSAIADRVRSAVATTINQTGIGVPIALSKIIAAAEKVVGVVAVTVISPIYNIGNDLITVQPFEKPLVLNLDEDIHISFNGE